MPDTTDRRGDLDPRPNANLLNLTLDHILAHPETWEQKLFRCETGMCFAGWACELDGGKWAFPVEGNHETFLVARDDDDDDVIFELDGQEVVDVEIRARRILGLTDRQGGDLFFADNNILDLRRIVGQLSETGLKLEIRGQDDRTVQVGGIMLTPLIDEGYWAYRVRVSETQAIAGFPKFGTIGVGFAVEEDWNTNLPYTCDADEIYDHIAHNKGDDSISREDCITAIQMIQEAARKADELNAGDAS